MGNKQVAEVHPRRADLPILQLYLCNRCGTFNFSGENPVMGYNDAEFTRNYWIHYIQTGAGIYEMLEPLFKLGERLQGDLLDIGCGFGYVVDFLNFSGVARAIGLESADYGAIGARLLGIPVFNSLYKDCEYIKKTKFDIVYSCEVIEHIENPLAFIKEITNALKEGGILTLTTPSAKAVSQTKKTFDVIATLSPYFHYFVSSKTALERLLMDAGFAHIRVEDTGNRLYAWASNSPIPNERNTDFCKQYYIYLNNLASKKDINLSSGALYRMFKYEISEGKSDTASSTLAKLDYLAKYGFGLSILNPQSSDFDENACDQKRPSWYGGALLYTGILLELKNENKEYIQHILSKSCAALKYEIIKNEFPQYVQESYQLLDIAEKKLRLNYANFLVESLHAMEKLKKEDISENYTLFIKLIKALFISIKNLTTPALLTVSYERIASDLMWWKKNWRHRLGSFLNEK